MWNNKKQKYWEMILAHPGISYQRMSKYRYLLKFKGRRWLLWPRSGRYQQLSQDGYVSEVFVGELQEFYHRYLTGELQLPENFGKTWGKADEETLYDMINYTCTVRQIADELKRHPISVVTKLAKYFDDDSIENILTQDSYDVAVRELVPRQKLDPENRSTFRLWPQVHET